MIFTYTNALARVVGCSALANDNVAGYRNITAKYFYT
jgi:hypothetical protein